VPRALQVLPPFPPVARKLMSLVGKPEVSFQQIAELIRSDAALSTQVLRLANSALLGARQEISSILRAIVLIGAERVKALAITACMKGFLGPLLENESPAGALLRRFWRHNLVCALLAEELAKPCWLDPDTAYTAGLLHDVGRLGLLKAFPYRYCDVLGAAAMDDADLLSKEREAFGVDHCEAGAWIAENSGFPAELIEAIAGHHNPPRKPFALVEIVTAARLVASMMGFQAMGSPHCWDLEAIQAHLDTGQGPPFQANEQELLDRISEGLNAIECSLL
jgi:putative nucleotidyltransferase with HDIG domain